MASALPACRPLDVFASSLARRARPPPPTGSGREAEPSGAERTGTERNGSRAERNGAERNGTEQGGRGGGGKGSAGARRTLPSRGCPGHTVSTASRPGVLSDALRDTVLDTLVSANPDALSAAVTCSAFPSVRTGGNLAFSDDTVAPDAALWTTADWASTGCAFLQQHESALAPVELDAAWKVTDRTTFTFTRGWGGRKRRGRAWCAGCLGGVRCCVPHLPLPWLGLACSRERKKEEDEYKDRSTTGHQDDKTSLMANAEGTAAAAVVAVAVVVVAVAMGGVAAPERQGGTADELRS